MEMTLEKIVANTVANVDNLSSNVDRALESIRLLSEENRISALEMKEFRESQRELAIEFRRELKEQNAEVNKRIDANIAQMTNSVDKLSKEVNKWVGYFGNTIGTIIEMVIIPGVRKKMNDLGHNFTTLSAGRQFYYANGNELAEVDLFLENGVEVMAVEIKTRLSLKNVERHVRRLERLREYEALTKITGLTLLAAVAGLTIEEEAREKALSLGMYVIEVFEDENRVNVIKPNGEVGKW